MDEENSCGLFKNFPLEFLVPKRQTQQEIFLSKNPEFDGRGVRIAVLDTGIDPALPGMQVTSHGRPKLIGCFDMTGAGEVDCSTVRQMNCDRIITGLSGRKLKIPAQWTNPTGKYHLGIKPIFELYTKGLTQRIKNERKEELWSAAHSTSLADIIQKIEFHEKQVGGTSEKLADKDDRENLNYQLEFLKSIDKEEDLGPVADCIVFNDGQKWRACIDTSFRGRLSLCNLLTDYSVERQIGVLSDKDLLSYSVNIHNDGNLLEICVTSTPHGSHVANIAAANIPNCPERNGLAPGAEVIGMCIGDHRLNGEETGQALIRAFNKCVELGVDIVNYSFGEFSHFFDSGRIIEALTKMVQRGVIFVCSAGNNGPALSSSGSPGSTASVSIGVGAYLAPEMVDCMYHVLTKVPQIGLMYPWSSRGPCPDGALGLSFSSPGAAITGVPRYELRGTEMMNGTSMSSPNATGAIACLLGAMKKLQIPITPLRVRLALENSAQMPNNEQSAENKLSFGQGLIQIDSAFELLKKMPTDYLPNSLYAIDVKVTEANSSVPSQCRRGIYIRELHQLGKNKCCNFIVSIEPKFAEKTDHKEKVAFEKHVKLLSDVPYLEHSKFFELLNQKRQIQVKVDVSALETGKYYYTEIMGIDSTNPELGPLFRVPITIILPLILGSESNYQFNADEINLKPGISKRFFVHVPKEAVFADFSLKSNNKESVTKYSINLVQLIPELAANNSQFSKHCVIEPEAEEKDYCKVVGGHTLEICLTKLWSDAGDSSVNFKLAFHGAGPQIKKLNFFSSQYVQKVKLLNSLRFEEVSPAITFRRLCHPMKPAEAKIFSLGSRETTLDEKQIFNLKLSYNFNANKATEFMFGIPGITDYLYESPFDGLFMQLFTSTKQYIGACGAFSDRYSFKLEKAGNYLLVVMFRHTSISFLERYRDLTVIASQKLAQPLTDSAFATAPAALGAGSRKCGTIGLRPGQAHIVYFAPIPEDRLPKGIAVGDYLLGSLTLGKADNEPLRKRVQFPVHYTITDMGKQKASNKTALSTVVVEKKNDKQIGEKEYEEMLREQQIQLLSKVSDNKFGDQLFNKLRIEYRDCLPLLIAQTKRLSSRKEFSKEKYDFLLELTAKVFDIADPIEVQQFFGKKIEHSEADLLIKKEMEKRKSAIVEALYAHANSVCDAHLRVSTQQVPKIFRQGLHYEANEIENEVDGAKDNGTGELENKLEEGEEPADESNGDAKADEQKEEQMDPSNKDRNTSVGDFQVIEQGVPLDEFQQQLEEMNAETEEEQSQEPEDVQKETISGQWIVTLQEVDEVFTQLLKWVDENDTKVLPIVAKRAVAHAHYGTALRALKKLADDKIYDGTLSALSVHTAMVELSDQLGWPHVSARLRNALLVKHRATYRPF